MNLVGVIRVSLAALLMLACGQLALAAPPERAALDRTYQAELEQLAAKCDELKLTSQATITRAWFISRLKDRQYLFLPPGRDPHALAKNATELEQKWHAKFSALRQKQAAQLFALSKACLEADDPTTAYQLLHEVLREETDHAEARAILGYTKVNGTWRHPGGEPTARKGTVAHGYLKLPAGSYYRITTPHFQIVSAAGSVPGLAFGEQLEAIYSVWRQTFFRYWSNADELTELFDSPKKAAKPTRPYQVVLFPDRATYLANLSAIEPRLELTQGIYLPKKQAFYFYLQGPRAEAICAHEATHQLFQETGPVAPEVGDRSNFWIVEGIALYMESLQNYEGYVTLGGWEADRLQFARHHVFNGQFQMPLAKLVEFGREQLQKDEDIKRIYSQSAGLAQYLMIGQAGKHREATIDYIASVYSGRDQAKSLASLTGVSLAEHDAAYKAFLQVNSDDVAHLPSPERVRNLCLGYQPVDDAALKKLAQCVNLHWLDLAAVPVTDAGLAPLAACKRLTQLNLEQTATTDAVLAWLGKLTSLVELDLSHTKITDAGVAKLSGLMNLRVLWLTGTTITDGAVVPLQRLKQLETLDVEGTKLSPAAIEKLRAALPNWKP